MYKLSKIFLGIVLVASMSFGEEPSPRPQIPQFRGKPDSKANSDYDCYSSGQCSYNPIGVRLKASQIYNGDVLNFVLEQQVGKKIVQKNVWVDLNTLSAKQRETALGCYQAMNSGTYINQLVTLWGGYWIPNDPGGLTIFEMFQFDGCDINKYRQY